jgi:hypothetical protein
MDLSLPPKMLPIAEVSTEGGGVQSSATEGRHSLLPVRMERARPREQDSLAFRV